MFYNLQDLYNGRFCIIGAQTILLKNYKFSQIRAFPIRGTRKIHEPGEYSVKNLYLVDKTAARKHCHLNVLDNNHTWRNTGDELGAITVRSLRCCD